MSRINRRTAWQRSRPGPPFSNSTEGELWSAHWCARCSRDAFANYGAGCPLVTIALCGRIPAEWVESPPEQVFTESGMNVPELYHCVEFRPRGGGDPEPRPKPEPDQDGLFERPARSARLLHQSESVEVVLHEQRG